MNIYIIKENLGYGGTERSAANISLSLSDNNDISMVLFDGSIIKYQYGGRLIDLQSPASSYRFKQIIHTIFRIIKLYKIYYLEKPQIMYLFLSIHNPINYIRYRKTKKIISARDCGKMQHQTKKFYRALLNSDAMICNSKYMQNYYVSKYPEHKEKVFTVYNIIDVPRIKELCMENTDSSFNQFIREHKKNIVGVGRFCKEKGFEYLIRSFINVKKLHSDAGLVLVGDGEKKEQYIDIIEKNNIEKDVYITGFQDNPYKYMNKCNCFVLSSISEGFPNVLVEAMAMGLPVISTNCQSGPAEILREDCNYNYVKNTYHSCDYGILIPQITDGTNNSIDQMTDAIDYLFSHEDILKMYSQRSKDRSLDFSKDRAKKALETIFHEVLNGKQEF